MVINILFYLEMKVVVVILGELDGFEGCLMVFVIVDCIGIICFVIVNVFCKLEFVGIIESCLFGMKGIYFKVINEGIFDKLKEYN